MLRRTILYLASHRALRNWVETSPSARRLSSRFVAGSQLSDALEVIRADGIAATLDYLGENVKTLDEAAAALKEVLQGKPGPMRDIALLNAAAALVVAERAEDLKAALDLVRQSLDGGRQRSRRVCEGRRRNALREADRRRRRQSRQ